MTNAEKNRQPEDGFINEIQGLIDSGELPQNVTELVKKYLPTSDLTKLNNAIRFCCSKGMNRPHIIETSGETYMLTNH